MYEGSLMKTQCEVLPIAAASVRESVVADITRLEQQLEKKRKLLALLNENPKIEEVLTLLREY